MTAPTVPPFESGPAPSHTATIQPFPDAPTRERWRAFATQLARRREPAEHVATCGHALTRLHEEGRPPCTAKDIDAVDGTSSAAHLLGRSKWDPRLAALTCASEIASRTCPEILLASVSTTSFPRASNFRIFGVSALYDSGTAVPLAWERAHELGSQLEDVAVRTLIDRVVVVSRKADTAAPLVACDFDLADYVIDRLAGDAYPFAALVGPQWSHQDITSRGIPRSLLSNSPFELFSDPELQVVRRNTASGSPVEIVGLQYRDNEDSHLHLARVVGADFPYVVARPAIDSATGVDAVNDAVAELALAASRLHASRPLERLCLEAFYASETENARWHKFAAVLQAVLTFQFIDPLPRGAS